MKLPTILAYVWISIVILVFIIYTIVDWPNSQTILYIIGFVTGSIFTLCSIIQILFHMLDID